MKQFLFIGFISFFISISAQEPVISIDSCISWSKRNYPAIKQNDYYLAQADINRRSINENWYPKLGFQAQATYNTEVVSFNFPGMNVSFPHDAYITSIGLEQVLLDGGQSKNQRQVDGLNTELEIQKNEVELYKLVERVNQLYVNILLGRENLHILQLYKEDLSNRATNVRAGVENGLVLSSSLDELEAEILKTDQNMIETQFSLQSLYESLSFYTAHTIGETTELTLEAIGGNTAQMAIKRPELRMLDLQNQLLDARYKLINVNAMPRLTFGAAANYGRPGPNFINQELRFFGSANLTLKWNISSLYGLKREKEKLQLNKSLVEIQRETFLFNLQSSMTTQKGQLNAITQLIATDDQIIQKRESVTKTAVSQMENGKITVANYLTQLNAELQAKLNKKVHEIKRMNTISIINATSGSIQF